MSDIVADRDTLLTVTAAAHEVVLGARADELDAASLALWLDPSDTVGGASIVYWAYVAYAAWLAVWTLTWW